MKKIIVLSSVVVLSGALLAQQRDPYKWPFTSKSIWNMPIHNNAVYVPAGFTNFPGHNVWATMPLIDDEHIVLKPTAPLTNLLYSSVGWSGGDRCPSTNSTVKATVLMPANYVVPNSNTNSCATFLAADGHTLMQNQPLARCTAGGTGTVLVTFPNVDLYSAGAGGNHGGSGLSGIGGSIRVGELRPGQLGPRHALKLVIYAKQYLYKGTTSAQCYRWPATNCDGYAVGFYGTDANGDGTGKANTNTAMKMGALVAIPASVNISTLGLETEPGKQIAWTLQNYGAYIVDDAYAAGFGFAAEDGPDGSVRTQFQTDYGTPLGARYNDNNAWSRDVGRLAVALSVVNNNDANNIGGGPTNDTINRRRPMACPFSAPGSGLMCPGITTNIINEQSVLSVSVYPNPFNANFTLKISADVNLTKAELRIVDLCGKEVKSVLINSNETVISRDNLQDGIYFYSIINNNESIGKGKLIVQ
jgi:hypothetical protein